MTGYGLFLPLFPHWIWLEVFRFEAYYKLVIMHRKLKLHDLVDRVEKCITENISRFGYCSIEIFIT
jgi:hypothetical protein